MTDTLAQVLQAFLSDPTAPRYGYELMKAAGLKSGTLYPMLSRLSDEGVVASEWEDFAPTPDGRPPRRYYKLTGEGIRLARLGLAEYTAQQRATGATPTFGWSPAMGSAT